MKNYYKFLAVISFAVFLLVLNFGNCSAAFNEQINFQGRLTDSSGVAVADGDYNMEFKLWSHESSTSTGYLEWTETCTSTNRITVTDGLFSHLLGSVDSLSGVDFNQTLWFGVNVGGSNIVPNWDDEMTPRKKLGAVPAAFEAGKLGGKTEAEFATLAENETITGAWTFNNIVSISASSSSPVLTVQQDGSGNIVEFKNATTSVFAVTAGGKVGIGTTTPETILTINSSSLPTEISMIYDVLPSAGSSFSSIKFKSKVTVTSWPGNWTTPYDTSEKKVYSLTFDSTNGVIYAGSGKGGFGGVDGTIYRCDTSTGCATSSNWTTAFDTSGEQDILSLLFDPINEVIYAGTYMSRHIYRCDTSTGCATSSDWTISFDPPDFGGIDSFLFDSTNRVIYAASINGKIYRCDTLTGTGCATTTDWTTARDGGEIAYYSLTFDSANGVIYAGADYGRIEHCDILTDCDENDDWIIQPNPWIDTPGSGSIYSLTFDSINGVIYAGSATDGLIYRCDISTKTNCYEDSEWATSYDTPESYIYSLLFDSTNKVIYAGTGDGGIIYSCDTSTGCATSTDWATSYDTPESYIYSLTFDSTNKAIYAGTGDNGIIYRYAATEIEGWADYAKIQGAALNTASSTVEGGIKFLTNKEGNLETRMIIYGDNVGIGTTTPAARLDIYASSTATALTVQQDGSGNIVEFKDGATTVFTITDGGNVGIATSTPQYPLHVWGSAGFGTSTIPTLYVDSGTGRVGIGTATPDSTLFINSISSPTTLSIGYNGLPGANNTFSSIKFKSKYYLSSSWSTSYDTSEDSILSLTFDSTNGVIYAGSGYTNGIIYRCDTSTGCDEAGDWSTSTDTSESYILSFTFDSTNGVIYGGSATSGIIYRCDTTTGCTTSTDWTTSYDTPEDGIDSLTLDSTNGVIYAGTDPNGIIYRCDTSTDCDEAGDWDTVYDSSEFMIMSLVFDSTNEIIYAGSGAETPAGNGIIFRCDTSTGCATSTDWTTSYNTPAFYISSFALDSTNGVIYGGASSDVGDNIIYRCDTSTGCTTSTHWTTAYTASGATTESLTFDSTNGVIYAGGYSGKIFSCNTSTGCATSSDWSESYDSLDDYIFSLAFDSTNGVIYAGSGYTNGTIFRYPTTDTQNWADYAEIQGVALNATTSSAKGEIRFLTNKEGNLETRMVIDEDGNVGIATTQPTEKLTVHGNILVNQEDNPVAKGYATLPSPYEGPTGVYVSGKYAYVTAFDTLVETAGLLIYDISDPDNIVLMDSYSTGAPSPQDVFVSGKYAYIARYGTYQNTRLDIYDVSNPTNIVKKDWIVGSDFLGQPPYFQEAISLYVSGRYAYVVTNSNNSSDYHNLFIFDVSDPNNIVAKDHIAGDETILNFCREIHVSGKYAYVASEGGAGGGTLSIFDVSDPNNIVTKDYATTTGRIYSVYVSGKYAYAAVDDPGGSSPDDKLYIFDISDPDNIVEKDSTHENLNFPYDVFVSGKYAYVVNYGNERLAVFDVSDPDSIVAKGYTSTNLSDPEDVFVSGKYAYVASWNNDQLAVFQLNFAELPTAHIGSLAVDDLQVYDNTQIYNDLYVRGGIHSGQGIYSQGETSIHATSSSPVLTVIQSGTGNIVEFKDASTTFFTIIDGGAVGIGTTSPATLLQVYGTTTAQTILPEAHNTYDLGSSTTRWANIYAVTTTIGTGSLVIGQEGISSSEDLTISVGSNDLIITSTSTQFATTTIVGPIDVSGTIKESGTLLSDKYIPAPSNPQTGDILYYTAESNWDILHATTTGLVLTSQGASTPPIWAAGGEVGTGEITLPDPESGDYATPSAAAASSGSSYYILNQTLRDNYQNLNSGDMWRTGQKITLTGNVLVSAKFRLMRTGAPTGTLYCTVRKVSDDSIIETSSTELDVSTVSTSWEWYEFALTSNPNEEVRISVEWNGGEFGNHISVGVQSEDVCDGVVSHWQFEAGPWVDSEGADRTIILKALGEDEEILSQSLQDTYQNMYSGFFIRVAQKITLTGDSLKRVRFYLKKNGSPTGTLYCRVRKVSDDSIIETSSTELDVSTLTTSYEWKEFALTSAPNEEVYVTVEFSGGSSGNDVDVGGYSADVCDGVFTAYSTSWTDMPTNDATIKLYAAGASLAMDDDTNTYWIPVPANEAGAWVRADLDSLKFIGGCRFYWGSEAAYRPTEYKIYTSPDASTWTEVVHETEAAPASAWKTYNWYAKYARYIKLIVTTHGSSGTKVYEVDEYSKSTEELLATHGHGGIDGADLAERFLIDSSCQEQNSCPEKGDLVKVNEGQVIVKTDKPYQGELIGVVSSNPGLILPTGLDENNSRLVALAGRVPVKVSIENGPIEVGDPITSGSMPGVGMKAIGAGRVVGLALEPYYEEGISKIMLFVNSHWIGNDLSVQENGQGQIINTELTHLRTALASLGLQIEEDGTLIVKKFKTQELEVEKKARFNKIEMVDQITGETYCTWIENGQWKKVKGECNEVFGSSEGCTTQTYYYDNDKDGYGHGSFLTACEQPEGYAPNKDDCDDYNPEINPGAVEICDDGIDNNCDGVVDNPDICRTENTPASTYYLDADGDSYGNSASSIQATSTPDGYVSNNTDCNDNDASTNPGASEVCNDGIDNDCDGKIDNEDDDCQLACGADYLDLCTTQADCQAAGGFWYSETCNNQCQTQTFYLDSDSDSYGDSVSATSTCQQPTGYVINSDDCNDLDPNINPAATEVCDNLDNNCDGNIDENLTQQCGSSDVGACRFGTQTCQAGQWGECLGAVEPVKEVCDDGIDNNCDGQTDEGCETYTE